MALPLHTAIVTDDWEASLAWRILQAVKSHAQHKLPGYDACPWEINLTSAKDLKHAGEISLLSLSRRGR